MKSTVHVDHFRVKQWICNVADIYLRKGKCENDDT